MSNAATTRHINPTYQLVQRDREGRLFQLTGLGDFKSGLAAADAWRSQPRQGAAYIQESRDAVRLGINYGTKCEIVAGPVYGQGC